MLEPGTTIENKYTVQALLGRGGMAAVYRVTHSQLGTSHALKILTLQTPQIRQRFLQEGRVQATLRHPNAVAVTDVLDVEGSPALLMEYIDGPDLEAWLTQHQPSWQQAEAIFRQIVAAVAEAHSRGLIHRDLKPANVLMSQQGASWVPKVADFGLAKLLDPGASGMGATRTGVTMGTPTFMAPEQIRDASKVDERADLWSLGCILYQLLTGAQAFAGDDIVAIFNAVTRADYLPLQQRKPELPPRFALAIDGLLHVDLARRIPSCEALLDTLNEEPHANSRAADHPPPLVQTERPPKTRRWALGIVALSALLISAATVGLIGALALLAWSSPAVPIGNTCGGLPGQVVGYAYAGPLFLKRTGSSWTLRKRTDVRADYPRKQNDYDTEATVVCSLPSRSKINIRRPPLRVSRKGTWIAVESDAITLPTPSPTEAD